MKKRIIYILFSIGILSLSSCEELKFGSGFLDKPPTGQDMTIDEIFAQSVFAERFLAGTYAYLPYGLCYDVYQDHSNKMYIDMLESITDLCHSFMSWGGVEGNYYGGQYSAGNAHQGNNKYSYTREMAWESIRSSWIFIENVDKVADMSEEMKAIRKGEAKMIIAVHYTELFRHLGAMPIVERAIYPGDNTSYPRKTVAETVEFICRLCDEAAADLPWTTSQEDDGRFTKAAAMGLKIRVLLFAASPLFNDNEPYMEGAASTQLMTWYGNKDMNRWQDVVDACEDFFRELERNGNNYRLLQTGNYRQDFQDAWYKRANGEVLISTRVAYTCPNYWDDRFYFMQAAGNYGGGCTTLNYIDMFPMADGSKWNLDWDNIPAGVDPFANRDPRLYETIVTNGDAYKGRVAEVWIGGREQKTQFSNEFKSGSVMRKFLLDGDYPTLAGSVIHWPYLRLAEIYYSYAEALNELGSTLEAYQWVEKVRARVGMPPMEQNHTKEQFREMILNERALEFGFEEVRWFDLIRWKRADDFTKPLYGLWIWRNDDNTYRYERWEITPRHWRKEWSEKWYLGAFPVAEVNKGPELVQNPGW